MPKQAAWTVIDVEDQCADLLIETDEDATDADEAAEHITRVADETLAAMTDEDHEVNVLTTRANILHLD